MNRFGRRTGLRGKPFGFRRLRLLGMTMALGLILAACGDVVPSTNTYPIDFFSEMHYSKAWTAGEPDGWNPPEGAVPITGGEVPYEQDEAADLENPFDANPELGAVVYALNCDQCHGPEGAGDGIVVPFWTGWSPDAPEPTNLQEIVGDRTDGEIFWVVTYGLEYMPRFGPLLTEEERWAVVDHLRDMEQ